MEIFPQVIRIGKTISRRDTARLNSGSVLLCSIILCFSVISSTRTCIATDQEPIYIHADGSIDPPTSLVSSTDNITYTLTGNIRDTRMGSLFRETTQ